MKFRNKKTGEVVESFKRGPIDLYFYPNEYKGGDEIERETYQSLAELNSEWEDYKPTEPLIKDEKIRKAVRAWADVCKIETDDAIMVSDLAPAFTRIYTSMYEIDIKTELSWGLDEHKDYTIAELCGEDEE